MESIVPWNKGKSVGQKKPLTSEQIQDLKQHLSRQESLRDLALFSFQIDTMLRSSDVIKFKVEELFDFNGEIKRELNVRQKKTKKPHIVAISEEVAETLENYVNQKKLANWLFPGNRGNHLGYHQHRSLWKKWMRFLNKDMGDYATHSGRRTRAVMIYEKTKDPKLVMECLGQCDIGSVTAYLGRNKREAIDRYKEEFLK